MHQVIQFHGEIDVSRDEDHCGGGGVGVGKPSQGLSQLVVCSIFGCGSDVDQCYLNNRKKKWEGKDERVQRGKEREEQGEKRDEKEEGKGGEGRRKGREQACEE